MPIGPRRDGAVIGQSILAGATMLCAAFYAVACAVDLIATNGIRALALAVATGQSESGATITGSVAFYDHARAAVEWAFWLMYLCFFALLVVIGRRYRNAGLRPAFGGVPAYNAWRIGVAISVVVLVVDRSIENNSGTLTALAHNASADMAFLGVRVAVGCLYVWCAWAILMARRSLPPAVSGPPLPTAAQAGDMASGELSEESH